MLGGFVQTSEENETSWDSLGGQDPATATLVTRGERVKLILISWFDALQSGHVQLRFPDPTDPLSQELADVMLLKICSGAMKAEADRRGEVVPPFTAMSPTARLALAQDLRRAIL